ncbi:unnamed protein product [Moneuplotes crassus]|uniref:Dystroglycan-type cadherin-like domain-containing protein n=1 Tax=Euplotes crassus TaxID=5936 RepID=A0AAD1XYF4_EUPCR|nr:unnamed protein product [Moneuplotes crassus]
MTGDYNTFSTDTFALKMDYLGKIQAMKFYRTAIDNPTEVNCNKGSSGFFMFLKSSANLIAAQIDSNLDVTYSSTTPVTSTFLLAHTSSTDKHAVYFSETNGDVYMLCMNGITDTAPSSLNFKNNGSPLTHSSNVLETGAYQVGFMSDGPSGNTRQLYYKVKTEDCSNVTYVERYNSLQYILQDHRYLQLVSLSNGEMAGNGWDPSDLVTPSGAFFFTIFDPNDLTTVYMRWKLTYFKPMVTNSIHVAGAENIYTVGHDSSKILISLCVYNATSRDVTMSLFKSLADANPGSLSTLLYSSGYYYASVGGTGFGSDISHENAAILKFGQALVNHQSCYSFASETSLGLFSTQTFTTTTLDPAVHCEGNFTVVAMTSVTIIVDDKYTTSPYYFKADEAKLETAGVNNCSLVIPSVTSNIIASDYTYYSTTGSFQWGIATGDSPSNIPYTISLFTNGTNTTVPVIITVDDFTFTADQKIKYHIDTTALGIWYDTQITYEFNFKVIVWDLPLASTADLIFTRTIKNDPIITTPVTNLSLRAGEFHEVTLAFQTNKSVTNAAGGIYYECLDKITMTASSICTVETSGKTIQTLNLADGGTTKEFMMRVYYDPSTPRDYDFNVTFAANTAPYFSSTLAQQYVNCGYSITITIPSGVDDQGDSFYYDSHDIPAPASSFTNTFSNNNPTLDVTNIGCTNAGDHIYTWKVVENGTNAQIFTTLPFTLSVNYLPKFNFTFPNVVYRIYVNETTFGSPLFCAEDGPDGNPITVNHTISPSPPSTMLTLSTSSECMFTFSAINNSFAGVYTVTLHAYDALATASQHNSVSFILTLQANQAPANITTMADQAVSTPINSDAGTYVVTVTASDGKVDTANGTSNFNVVFNANTKPIVNQTLTNIVFVEGRANTHTHVVNTFSEPNSEAMSITGSFTPVAPFLSYNNLTRVISGSPAYADIGTYTFTLTAVDPWPDTGSTTQSMTITIEESLPPVSSETFVNISQFALSQVSIDYDETLVTDPNGDTISFDLTHNTTGSWATVNAPLMKLTGTPTNSDIGNFTINFRVYDAFGKETTYTMNLEIIFNNGPVYTGPTALEYDGFGLHPFSLNLSTIFNEPDGQDLTWTLTSVGGYLTWLSVDNTTNILSGTPNHLTFDYNQSLVINAFDPNGQTATKQMHFNIKSNTFPSLSGVPSTSINCYEGVQCDYDFSTYAADEAGDTIQYNDTFSNPAMACMTFDKVAGTFSCMPTVSDVSATAYLLHVYTNDQYKSINGETNTTFSVYINPNRSPQLNTAFPNLTLVAGESINYTFASDMFVDLDGEPVTYTKSYPSSDPSSWLSFNDSTRTFSGFAAVNSAVGTYIITIYADDNNTNSAARTTNFTITVTQNYIPQLDQGLPAATAVSVFYEFSYSVPTDAFKDIENDPMTIRVELVPPDFTVTYTPGDRTVRGTLTDNTKYGDFILKFHVEDNWNISTFTENLPIRIDKNDQPIINFNAPDPSCIIAHYALDYSVPKSSYSDDEGETLSYSHSVNDVKGAWISLSENTTHLLFSGTPDNSQFGNYTLTIIIRDTNPSLSPSEDNVTICVIENQVPYLSGTPTSPSNVIVGFPFIYHFDLSWVSEHESEALTHQCSITPSPGWITCSQNATHVSFTGTPNSNSFVGQYELSINNIDPHADVNNYTWTMNFTVNTNHPTIMSSVENKELLVPDSLTWSYGAGIASDPEGLSFTNIIKLNGSTTIPSWLINDPDTFSFSIASTTNSYAGVHTVTLATDDGFNTPTEANFTLTINENRGPVRNKVIGNPSVVNYNLLHFEMDPVDVLFTDPDGRAMTSMLRQADDGPIPSFLTFNSMNNTLYGTPEIIHVGVWDLEYIATDDFGQQGVISFKVIVKPCYFKCNNCTTEDYNQCQGCFSGYFLQYEQCKTECTGAYWPNTLTNKCEECHSYCSLCKDGTSINCQTCAEGYFYLDNACYETCPDGYYGDTVRWTCNPCHEACTKCFGSERTECTECDRTLFYSLTGTTCNKVTCVPSYYLNTTDLSCYPCGTGCDRCEYPDVNNCLACDSVHKMLIPGTCTHCNNVTGYSLNDFGVCKEICGDGLFMGEYECDDGNLVNLDGCSNNCEIEIGYKCNGTTCYEIINPTAILSRVSSENTCTLTFSEPVKFSDFGDFNKSLKAYIRGPKSPYTFKYSIDEPEALKQATNFTSIQVKVHQISSRIEGGGIEKIEFWFQNLTAVTDVVGNSMTGGKISGNLNYYDYISQKEKERAESGGSSMKYMLMTMFSTNLLLKVIISSSAALMWSLIHALQVFRYILMINIEMPKMVDILMKYLAVVVGEIDELESMVPDWFSQYIVNATDLSVNITLYNRFEVNGYDTPFLALLFSQQMTIIFGSFIVSLPIVYFGKKYFKKISFFKRKMGEIWTSFFWNAPLRTFTELYIEICLAFFLNTLNIQFLSTSGVICTSIMFVVGIFVLMWPFILLNIISTPPKILKKPEFNDKYGTLTEDFMLSRTMYHRSYYIIFCFQRLLIAGILVMMYEKPLLQISLCFAMQLALIGYLIRIRPFKSELQQVICVSDEFTIVFGVIVLYNMYRNQANVGTNKKLAFLLIGVILASLLKNLTTIIYISIKNGYLKCRNSIRKRIKHDEKKKKRLKKEALEKLEKLRKQREEQDLLENGANTGTKNFEDPNQSLKSISSQNNKLEESKRNVFIFNRFISKFKITSAKYSAQKNIKSILEQKKLDVIIEEEPSPTYIPKITENPSKEVEEVKKVALYPKPKALRKTRSKPPILPLFSSNFSPSQSPNSR